MIRLEALDLDTIEITAETRLGDAWGPYQAAIKAAGARNKKLPSGRWQTTAPVERATEIESNLRSLGFAISIGPGLAACRDQERVRVDLVRDEEADRERFVENLEETSGLRLFDYQRQGVRWLAPRSRALLLDEMGVGKTLQVLAALPEGAATIVVCPAAVKAVWRRELTRFRPEFDVEVLRGRGSFRWPQPGEVVILNFELLPEIVPEGCPSGVVLVADEAHAFKSFKAKRTQVFRALGAAVRARAGRTWLLTGTPLTNKPPDLWGVLQAAGLATDTFGSWPYFAELFGGYQEVVDHRGTKVWFWGKPRGDEVAGRLRAVSLRRHKADVLPELPAKTREILTETELGAKDRKALDRVWDEIRKAGLAEDEETGKKKLPTFEGMSEARAILARAKLPLLEAIVESHEEANEPLVVFSAHKAPVEAIGSRPGWGLLTGDVSAEKRAELVLAFQAGQLKGLACTIQAAGVGLTMTAASHVVFVDLDWTPALNVQAEDRLHRIGQQNSVLVTVLSIDHPLEARILELCSWKAKVFEATVGASASYKVTLPTEAELEAKKARKPRSAATEVERWAERACLTLSGLDPDGAAEKNDVGWNRVDGGFGHRLAERLSAGRGLSDGQWGALIRMVGKYHRQIGRKPEEEPTSDFANEEGGLSW